MDVTCYSVTEWSECLHLWGPEPHAQWLFETLEIQIESSMSDKSGVRAMN